MNAAIIQYALKITGKMFCLRLSGPNFMRFESNLLNKDSVWKTDGEVIVIDADLNEFKEYFIQGNSVDWTEYKKMRPEDKLNLDELKAINNSRK